MVTHYDELLKVSDLYTSFNIPAGEVRSVNGVSFTLKKGRVLGIVGESGSGKSVTAYSIMQILQKPGRIVSGSIKFKGKELIGLPHHQLQKIRGDKIAIIFQDPMSSLNPVYTIGNQIIEAIKLHPNARLINELDEKIKDAKIQYTDATTLDNNKNSSSSAIAVKEAKEALKKAKWERKNYAYLRALEMLKLVGINEPERRMKQYPFEFSGGMLQRIMIAMSLVCEPDLLIADEPTTALDVTIQAQILELLKEIQKKMGMGIIIITHDLGVVAQICDEVAVMYAGRIVEKGTVQEIFYSPKHEYTKGLMNSIPQINDERESLVPIEGNPVDVFCLPKGCSFAPRCNNCMKVCLEKYPARVAITEHHATSCFKYIIDAYKEGLLNKEQLDKILYHSNPGNASFSPISRLDILDALDDYRLAYKKYEKAKQKENIDEETLEQFEFVMKEAKANYNRSKKDFKTAKKTRRFSRKEKPSTQRGDMAKKIKDAKKEMALMKEDIATNEYVYDYIKNLSIHSFPANIYFHKSNVTNAKQNYKLAKKSLKKVDRKDVLTVTQVLCDIDNARRTYENACDDYDTANRVANKLIKTQRKLVKINTERVIKTIKFNTDNAIKQFKINGIPLSKKELSDFLNTFHFTSWKINNKITQDDVHKARVAYTNTPHNLNKLRKSKEETDMHKTLDAATLTMLNYLFKQGDYSIKEYFETTKSNFETKIRELNSSFAERNTLQKGGK